MIFEAVRTVLGDLLESIAKLFVGKSITVGEQIPKITKDLLDRLDITLIAVDQQFIAASPDRDVEQSFKVFNVLVLNAEKRIESLRW